jgi:hypothetical protein
VECRALKTIPLLMCTKTPEIFCSSRHNISPQHHNNPPNFSFPNLNVKINLWIFNFFGFTFFTLSLQEKIVTETKLYQDCLLFLLNLWRHRRYSQSCQWSRPACCCNQVSSDQTGRVDPSLILCGLAKFTRIVLPNNSASFYNTTPSFVALTTKTALPCCLSRLRRLRRSRTR